MRIAMVLLFLIIGCGREPQLGVSKEKAEDILREYGFKYINIRPTPEGWEGIANRGPDRYMIAVKVSNLGGIDFQPYR